MLAYLLAFWGIGFFALIAQALYVRELLVEVLGNELVIGVVLVGVTVGVFVGDLWSERVPRAPMAEGQNFVDIGNLPGHEGESAYCPSCGKRVAHRLGYMVRENLLKRGKCPQCGAVVAGLWSRRQADESMAAPGGS